MTQRRFEKSELKWTDTDYLCLFCYDPIYYHAKTKKEICANPKCILYPIDKRIFQYDPNHQAVKPFLENFDESVKKFYVFSKQFLYKRLYDLRAKACHDFFANNGLRLQDLLGINYLLVSLDSNALWGKSTNLQQCNDIILEYFKKYDDLHFIEELELRNYMLTETAEPYVMKCYDILVEIRKVLGIVNQDKYGPDDVNSFYFLDRQARSGTPSGPYDFTTIFKNHYSLVITTNHIFKYGYFISKIHQYPAKTSDLAMLFSLWTMCKPTELCSINYSDLKKTYDETMSKNNIQGNFDEFLDTYSSGNKFAPIIVHDGSMYHFDYATLFISMFYVFSLNKKIEGTQTLSGFQTLNDQRQISAKNFEKIIREKFRKENYIVFPANDDERFEPTFDGQQHEYDCIAIDEDSKKIILIDAKYEDIAPSSTAGETIVEQAVLDKRDGLLLYCKEQHKRRRFFIKYYHKMSLGITHFWDYKIVSLVVTKHVPLIKRHLTTSVLSYDDFKDYDFKNT